jgi:hypothetical protein
VILKIRSDYGGKSDSIAFEKSCIENIFIHEFSTPRTT